MGMALAIEWEPLPNFGVCEKHVDDEALLREERPAVGKVSPPDLTTDLAGDPRFAVFVGQLEGERVVAPRTPFLPEPHWLGGGVGNNDRKMGFGFVAKVNRSVVGVNRDGDGNRKWRFRCSRMQQTNGTQESENCACHEIARFVVTW